MKLWKCALVAMMLAALPASAPTKDTKDSAVVIYFAKDKVSDAFAKGTPLMQTGAYKVIPVHRDTAGVPEFHAKDTDVIYVLKGTATFISGGTMIEGKTTAPDEIRGTSIDGGNTLTLSKGDVIIVPNGIPHWFKEASKPFDYLMVKITAP